MKRALSCWQCSAAAVIRVRGGGLTLWSSGLRAGISLLFSSMGSCVVWATVREIEIATRPDKPLGRANGFKTTGAVTGAAIFRLIDETLDRPHGGFPALLPVGAQTPQ